MNRYLIKFRNLYLSGINNSDFTETKYLYSPVFKNAIVFNSKDDADKCAYSILEQMKSLPDEERKKVKVIAYSDEIKEIEWNNKPKTKYVFVRKNKVAFLGLNKTNNKLVLNIEKADVSSDYTYFELVLLNDDTSTLKSFLDYINSNLTRGSFIAITPVRKFLAHKAYQKFISIDGTSFQGGSPVEIEIPDFILK